MATQTMQQKRAAAANRAVEELLRKYSDDESKKKKLRARVSELPFMIHVNGLGQAVAFFKSKASDPHGHGDAFQLLQSWLLGEGQVFHGKKDLMAGITESSMKEYMAAQAEAMLYMEWVKKLTRALVSGG